MQNSCSNERAEYAGFWVRLAAYVIDCIIVFVPLLAVRIFFLAISSLIEGTFLSKGILFHHTLKDIMLYVVQVLYFILMTYYTGTTLGKKLFNLCVVSAEEEQRLTLLNVIYRETVGRFLSGLFMGIGYIIAGADKEKRGLHDILCDTRVIYAKKVKVYKYEQRVKTEPVVQPVPQMMPKPPMEGQAEKYVYTPQMVVHPVEEVPAESDGEKQEVLPVTEQLVEENE